MNKRQGNDKTGGRKAAPLLTVIIVFVVGFVSGAVFGVYQSDRVPGMARESRGNSEIQKMAEALEEQVAQNPENGEAWIQLGHIYFDADEHEKAIQAYRKALKLDPGNADIWTDLGVMYRRSGNAEKAVEAFDHAIAANPSHEIARFNKGIVLLHDLKDRQGAIRVWEDLLKINPQAATPNGQSVADLVRHYSASEKAQP